MPLKSRPVCRVTFLYPTWTCIHHKHIWVFECLITNCKEILISAEAHSGYPKSVPFKSLQQTLTLKNVEFSHNMTEQNNIGQLIAGDGSQVTPPRHMKLDQCNCPNCCSCRVTGQHNILEENFICPCFMHVLTNIHKWLVLLWLTGDRKRNDIPSIKRPQPILVPALSWSASYPGNIHPEIIPDENQTPFIHTHTFIFIYTHTHSKI